MDYLAAQLEVKAVQATQRIISGFAAGIGNTDRVQDVIAPGAFTKTLASKTPGDVAVFIGHKTDSLPVGIPLVIREQAGGLYTETLIKPGPAGDDLLATAEFLQRHGKALGMSIGYRVHPGGATLERGRDGKMLRKLTSVDLLEFSYAAAQSIANEQALVTGVKTEDTMPEPEQTPTPAPILWDAAYLATLPDSAFLRVDAGEQEGGRTIPATKRHWAYRDAEGKIAVDRLEDVLPDLTAEPVLQGRVQWLLAQPESKLAEADTADWQAGAAPTTYGLAHRLLALSPRMATGQKARREWDQDTRGGRQVRPAELTELDAIIAELKVVSEMAHLEDSGAYATARSAWWDRELELLALGV